MSWDADLDIVGTHSAKVFTLNSWNYTHNTSNMIYLALERSGDPRKGRWWSILDSMSGSVGANYLSKILEFLAADRPTFVALNPVNGWGDYDSLINVLIEMRDWSRDFPTAVWHCSG